MSEKSTPSLKQYFGSPDSKPNRDDNDKLLENDELSQTADRIEKLQLQSDKQEPGVCRIFTDNPIQPKDPTASFFDLIGNSITSVAAEEVGADLGIPHPDEESSTRGGVDSDCSETDRRRDAWIPSEKTRKCLRQCATVTGGALQLDQELLTMPGVLLEEELIDTVKEAVSAHLGEAEATQRRVLTANDVTQNEQGLRELVQAGAYRSAINLTARLLTVYGQGRGRSGHPTKHSPNSLQLWFTRISLLIKVKNFSLAQAEAAPFGQLDKPDVFYQFYPDIFCGRSGSIASFSFRLLLAELPMHCGKPKESLTKLFNILAIVRQMLANLKNNLSEDGNSTEVSQDDKAESLKLWNGRENRIMHSIINCALTLKDYELAMDLLGQLCEREGAPRHSLLSALGRLHLQLGDVAGAEVCFNEAREIRGGPPDVRELVDRGLIAVAQNAFTDAYTCFQQASALEPSNVMILNNMAVCLLYSGHLKDAIAVLESAVSQSPVQALQESLLLNLCTLYDMESSKGRLKKFALLRQIAKYQADAPTQILEKLYG